MKILIVDDIEENLYLLETLLKGSGYEVELASNGAKALEKLHGQSFDMIISDILMPVMDGFQLCRNVMADNELRNIPFIFYTATYTSKKDEEFALKLGADMLIVKPLDPVELIKIIQDLFRNMKKDKGKPQEPALEREKEVLKLYSERLVNKLEKKMFDLEKEITERKQIEEALKKSEKRLREVIDHTQAGYFFIDRAGCFQEVNSAWLRMHGYESADEVIGRHFSLTQIETDIEKSQQIVEMLLAGKSIQSGESSRRYHDGSVGYHQFSIDPVTREDEIIGLEGFIIDITERRQAEEALKKSEASLIEAQHISKIGNWDYDVATDKPTWSYEMFRIFDFDPNDGEPNWNEHSKRIHHDDWEQVDSAIQTAIKKGIDYNIELRIIHRNNTIIWANSIGHTIKDDTGKVIKLFGTVQDITERKQAEEALQNSQHYLDRIINAVGSPLFVKDINHKFCLVNDALCSLLNLSVEEIIGTTGYEHFPEDQMTVFIAKDQEVFTTGKENINEQFLTDGHGKIRTIVTRKTLYTDSAGNKFLVGVINDITDRKQAEERILQFNAELKNSNQELEQFAYVASHDLQEPLRMISSYTQLLERRYGDKLDQDAKDFIEFAVDGANRMQKLINDLLEFSRVTTRAKPSEEVDSYTILGRAITNLQQVIQETGTIVTNDDLPKIKADDSQLVRVFQNIIDNAIKFCSKESPRIHISAQEDENECIFSIRDNGIGIDEQYKNRIFNIFQRLHTKEEYPGTGIGLAICKRIVQRHNGRIWFKSELGKGTTFYFTLKK